MNQNTKIKTMKESNSELRDKIAYEVFSFCHHNDIHIHVDLTDDLIDGILDLFHQHTAQMIEEVGKKRTIMNDLFGQGWNHAIDTAIEVIKKYA